MPCAIVKCCRIAAFYAAREQMRNIDRIK